MPTTCKSTQFQPLLDNEDLDKESVDDEQKKERRKEGKIASEMMDINEGYFVKKMS
jgi:hypothetical protein